MIKLKAKDKVKILSGKDSGREGEVEKIIPKNNTAVIPGLNIYKKHVKGQGKQKGGIYEIPRPVPISNLMLICPKCKKAARVGFRTAGQEKVRFCKKCDKQIDTK